MPAAFNGAGLVLGIFATIIVAMICTHCSYILVSYFAIKSFKYILIEELLNANKRTIKSKNK